MKPEILCHPNIPKPLHGINPRTIMGQQWWDAEREKVYASTGYRCAACGIHKSEAKGPKWLEAHEFWHIDYMTGRCEITSIEPLCHYCHNFIHSGRLSMIAGREKTEDEVDAILEHGMKVLSSNKLKCFSATYYMAKERGVKTFDVEPDLPSSQPAAKWNDYVLVWNGEEYRSKFKSQAEWSKYYSRT